MSTSKRVRHIIALILLAVTLALIYKFRAVLPMFVLALFLAYILTPVVVWISTKTVYKRKIPRGVAIVMIYLVMITSVSFGGAYFVINLTNEVQLLIKDIPSYGEKFTQSWVPTVSQGIKRISKLLPKVESTKSQETVNKTGQPADSHRKKDFESESRNEFLRFMKNTRFEVKQGTNGFEVIPHEITQIRLDPEKEDFDFQKYINDFISSIFENLQAILLGFLDFGQVVVFSVVTSIFQTLITLMVTAFIIIDHEKILGFFKELFPTRFMDRIEMFLQKQNTGLHGVVRGQLIICAVNGTLTGIGLLIFDVKFALTLSLLATVCSLIPIFGVFISSIPIIMMALTNSFFAAVAILGWILLIHFIEANILNPKIIGKSAEIHPVLVILALMAGEGAYGIFGALIAVPIYSILQTTFIFIREMIFDEGKELVEEEIEEY